MKICLLPLDSRPCTYSFPAQLAEIYGECELVQPPLDLMDYFRTPSCQTVIWQWLLENSADADFLVLSIEQLLYGGLVASRSAGCGQEELEWRLNCIAELKRRNPRLKIYAFNIIMRATVSTLSQESQVWWEQIAQYSRLRFLAETAQEEQRDKAASELRDWSEKIPAAVLEEFLEVRRRNHTINRRCIELCAEGLLDKLVLLQEDCAPQSLQLLEQRALLDFIEKESLQQRVWLHNGTDEAAMELVVLAAAGDIPRPVSVVWLGENRGFTAKYEDRPFAENVKSHLRLMNLTEDKEAAECLVILPPRKQQGDYCPHFENPNTYDAEQYQRMSEALMDLAKKGKRCYLLDVTYANGGDREFLTTLAGLIKDTHLYGYAAWNTASNSLGTVLAQMVASHGKNYTKKQTFTYERLLDDLFYQAILRTILADKLNARKEDIWCIQDKEAAENLLRQTVAENSYYAEQLFGCKLPDFCMSLPWPRIFEVRVNIIPGIREKG